MTFSEGDGVKTIQVEIDGDGNATIKVDGVAGKACEDMTRDLENALGSVAKRDRTADYHRREARRGQQARH